MTRDKISSLVTHTVLLGSAEYSSPLTITSTGEVIAYGSADGTSSGTVGIMAVIPDVVLVNHGNADGASEDTPSTGVDFRSGGDTLINTGGISAGSPTYATPGVEALDGVDIYNGRIANSGAIAGGGPGFYREALGTGGIGAEAGAIGVALLGTSRMTNSGTVIGGGGGQLTYSEGARSGTGGVGVSVAAQSAVSNTGTIAGGFGGSGPFAGLGGEGAVVEGGTLVNRGLVIGGAGGQAYAAGGSLAEGGSGGAGLLIDGGTVRNFGTISGGSAGSGATASGEAGIAVQFGAASSVLDIGAGAVFDGLVVADPSADDVLGLVGTASGTLAGLGSAFTGFTTIREAASAHWTLAGSSELQGTNLNVHGSLTLLDAVSGSGSLHLAPGGVVVVQGSLSLKAIAFQAGGRETLGLSTAGTVASLIEHFGVGDTIDLLGVVSELTYQNGALTLAGADFSQTLQLSGQYAQAGFVLSGDGAGGTDVTYGPSSAMHERTASNATTANWHTHLT